MFALQLFASVLLPFVAAAGIAYFLDPPATRLPRAGMPRGAAALLLVVALVAAGAAVRAAAVSAAPGADRHPDRPLAGYIGALRRSPAR